jgi:hypothetical protein
MTPLGMLFIIAFLVGSSWALGSLVRRLRREHASTQWWVAFVILVFIGVSGGIWCAFHCEYPLGGDLRIGSFPIPVVFSHLEDGQWVDFPFRLGQQRLPISSPSRHSPQCRFGYYHGGSPGVSAQRRNQSIEPTERSRLAALTASVRRVFYSTNEMV